MKKHAFKALPTYNATDRVDAENGIIHGVVLVQKGVNKNGSYFSDAFLSAMEKQGNEKGEIKARFGHPNMCATALGTYIGDYKNFRVGNGKLYGDLHLCELAKKVNVPNGGVSMYDYIVEMAQKHPEKFGNSIVIYADEEDNEILNEKGEKQTVKALILEKWAFSDLVDDPAATDSLFHDTNDLGAKITEFLDDNPKIFDVLEQNPQIFADFFQRYEHYTQRKQTFNNKDMSFFKKVSELLKGKSTFDVDLTLANGDIITVVTEAEQPQVGDPVKRKTDNGEEKEGVLEDGEHVTQDGKTLVVAGGVITEIKEAQPEPEPTTEPTGQQMETLVKEAVAMAVSEATKQFNEKVEVLSQMVLEQNKKFETLAKGVKSQFNTEDPAPTGSNFADDDQPRAVSAQDVRERQKLYKS